MTYNTDENAVILYDMILRFIALVDLSDEQSLKKLRTRLTHAGTSYAVYSTVRDLIEEIEANGLD